MGNRDHRIDNLRRANQRKSDAARAAVESAVDELIRKGARLNVNAVARASGVSRGFIYGNADLHKLIAAQAELERSPVRSLSRTPNVASLTHRLASALDAVEQLKADKRELEAENRRLERRVENLVARVFDLTLK